MENYIVIGASNISDLNESVFVIEKNKENDIKKMLEDNQKYFVDYLNNGDIKQPVIYDNNDIPVLRDEIKTYNNCFRNFISPINRIEVMKNDIDGKYVSTNNKQILNIAKKYNLKVLVYLE